MENVKVSYIPFNYVQFPEEAQILMREIAQEDYNWAECKSRLVSKIGVYYTEEELNDYILNYDIWFQNN